MLSNEVRKLFTKWKLYEREWKSYSIIHYEHPLIKIEWIFKKNDKREKNKMHDLIFNLYFDYEYEGKPMSSWKLWYLLGCDHKTITAIERRALAKVDKPKIKPEIEIIPQ